MSRSNYVFKTIAGGNEIHIIMVYGLKDHSKPLPQACLEYMPLLRDKSGTQKLKDASLHVFSFTTETLFRKGEPELQALADGLLRTSNVRRYKSNSSQCFMFIGHGLACWVIEYALTSRHLTTGSWIMDRICGVILWEPPERQEDSEWGAFVSRYINNGRKNSVSLQAELIRTIEKNFKVLKGHAASPVPAIKRIKGSNLSGSESKSIVSPMRRAKYVWYRPAKSIARQAPEQMFTPVTEFAMELLAGKISEIHEQRASGVRQPAEGRSEEGPSAPAKAQSIDAITRLHREKQSSPSNQSKQSLVLSPSLKGIGAWEKMSSPEVGFATLTKKSLEQIAPTTEMIPSDENVIASAPTMQLEDDPINVQEIMNDESMVTAATAMQRAEQPSRAQDCEDNLKGLQHHARAYLCRGEHIQAWILYSQMSDLLHKQRSRRQKADPFDSTTKLDFEVEHQLAMKALKQGEWNEAKLAFEKLRKDHERLALPETIIWSLNHWLGVVYIELGSYHRAITLTKEIPRSIEPHTKAVKPSYSEQLPEHQAEWLVFHAQALSYLARAREYPLNQECEEVEELFASYEKRVEENTDRLRGTRANACDDEKGRTQAEQSLRFRLTIVQVRVLAGRQKAAKILLDDKKSEDCARVLGKTHPLTIERLVLEIQLLLPAASRHCDEKFRELQDAMQQGYATLQPLTLSVCELQLAISFKQGRLTEAMNATKNLISRIDAAHLGKNHFRSLQARRWRVRVLFERGEVAAALSRSEELITDCQSLGIANPMHSFALACVVDSILMHLRLRHYVTAEITLLRFFEDLRRSMLLHTHTSGPDIKPFSEMACKDVVLYLMGLPDTNESKTPVDPPFATCYLTALQCLYICYQKREALSSDISHRLATHVLERRKHQSIGADEHLDVFLLLYNLALVEREMQDFEKALKHLQEAQTGLINALGHDHPHTLLVDFELRLVKLQLIGIENEETLSSAQDGDTTDSVYALEWIRLQKTVLVRLDKSLGGSHIFTVAARIDLANVLWESDIPLHSEHLQLEIMWYLLPYKESAFRTTPTLPFTASETRHLPSSQHPVRVLRDKLHHEFEAILSYTDGTVELIDERFLAAIASFSYDNNASGYYMEAITAQYAYIALGACSGMHATQLVEAQLELGYMYQSCADTCSDSTIRNQRYLEAMKIYENILQTEETYTSSLYNAARSFLGAIYFQQGKLLLARDEQEKVYHALKDPQTDDTYTLLDSIYNLALTEKSLDNNDRALWLWREGREISSRKLGPDDEQTKLFDKKLKDWEIPQTRPSTASESRHGNQRDSVMAASPKRRARKDGVFVG